MPKKPQATNQWGSKGLVRRDTSVEKKKAKSRRLWGTGCHPYDGTGESKGKAQKKKNAGMALTPEYDCMEYNRFVAKRAEGNKKLHGTNLFGKSIDPSNNLKGLMREFLYPPFSVLNGRDGHWQRRKRMWNRMDVKAIGDETLDERSGGDPVLAELMLRWFCPPKGVVVDPFAGSASWGIVSSVMGYQYFGVDINPNQVAANRVRATKLGVSPTWKCGDSREIVSIMSEDYYGICDEDSFQCDVLLSCPPYSDLEVYSDDPRDLSTMKYPEFLKAYRTVIRRTCSLLKQDRFAVWVVGEIRDSERKGSPYRSFVCDTIRYFEDAGMDYYNQMVLVTAVGSLPVRAGRSFRVSRKIGPTHQSVLVFVKGDPRKAAEACNG